MTCVQKTPLMDIPLFTQAETHLVQISCAFDWDMKEVGQDAKYYVTGIRLTPHDIHNY